MTKIMWVFLQASLLTLLPMDCLAAHLRERWVDVGEDTHNYITSAIYPPSYVYKGNASFYYNELVLGAILGPRSARRGSIN